VTIKIGTSSARASCRRDVCRIVRESFRSFQVFTSRKPGDIPAFNKAIVAMLEDVVVSA